MPNWLDTPGKSVPGNIGVEPAAMKPLGFQQISTLSSAVGLTVPAGALIALIQAESQDVRWRDDGSNPSATVGMTIGTGLTLPYTGDLSAIKFIEISASAKLNVSYYG
jgi:hypothetical protein